MSSASSTSLPSTTSPSAPTCTTATPGHNGYVPLEACNAYWAYSPSYAGALAIAVLFGILTVSQLILAIRYRKAFCWVLIMGAAWELGAFITRALGAHDQQSAAYATTSSLLFLLAPLWINAFVYMTAGRMIWTFHPDKKIWGIKAISLGKYFVWLDVVAFIIQATGGLMLNPGNDAPTMKTGKDVYLSGMGIQQFFILLFLVLIVRFQLEVSAREKMGARIGNARWKWVTWALYAALVLVTMRIIFRLVEFTAGTDPEENPIPYDESYALGLDAFPMLLAITILTVIHPGLALKGPESEFPSRKEQKAAKKVAKDEKKARKVARKEQRMAKTRGADQDSSFEAIQSHGSCERLVVQDIEMDDRNSKTRVNGAEILSV